MFNSKPEVEQCKIILLEFETTCIAVYDDTVDNCTRGYYLGKSIVKRPDDIACCLPHNIRGMWRIDTEVASLIKREKLLNMSIYKMWGVRGDI